MRTWSVYDARGCKVAGGLASRQSALRVPPPSEAHLYKVLQDDDPPSIWGTMVPWSDNRSPLGPKG